MARKKLTEAEKERRKHERKAERMNAAEAKAFGPLFAEMAPVHTAEDAYWHRRKVIAQGVEMIHQATGGPGIRALTAVQLQWIEAYARLALPAGAFDVLLVRARRTYSNYLDYGYGFWQEVLTGNKRLGSGFEKVDAPDTLAGFRWVEVGLQPPPDWVPPLTKAQFWDLFPYKDRDLDPEPDDGGLFERTILALTRGTP